MITYCSECGEECQLVREVIEHHPGQYTVAIISDCCHEPVVDDLNKPFRYGELHMEYEMRRSYEL